MSDIEHSKPTLQLDDVSPSPKVTAKSTAVSVTPESDVTPITRTPIEKVDSNQWEDLTISELYQQLSILEQRKFYCYQYSPTIVPQIQAGIQRLRSIIDQKQGNDINLL